MLNIYPENNSTLFYYYKFPVYENFKNASRGIYNNKKKKKGKKKNPIFLT